MNRIGILDADIHGPSILGIKVVSIDFLLPDEYSPVIWRGPLKMSAIRQFLSDIDWGELDILLIDLPPGTGDEPLSIAQLLPEMTGVIIVTIPSEVSQIVVKKAITFARRLNLPIIGILENMSGFVCPKCGAKVDIFQSGGGKKMAQEMSVPFLGAIPIDQKVCKDADKGIPFITQHNNSPAFGAFTEIIGEIKEFLEERR